MYEQKRPSFGSIQSGERESKREVRLRQTRLNSIGCLDYHNLYFKTASSLPIIQDEYDAKLPLVSSRTGTIVYDHL